MSLTFAANLTKMIDAGLGGEMIAPDSSVAVGYHTEFHTASGAIASWDDPEGGLPLKSLVTAIEPIQSGTGDPSPDNVRPISGRQSVTVTRAGKNLLEFSPTTQTINGVTFTVNDDGTIALSGTATQNTNYFLSSGERSFINGSFVFSGCPSGGGVSTYYLRIDNATGGALAADYGDGKQFTISDGKIYTVYINVKSGVNTNGLVFKPMIELGSTATAYEAPQIQTVEVQLGQTVYGGTVDVTTGEMVVDRAMVDLGTLTWTRYRYQTAFYYFRCFISDMKNGISGEIPNILSSMFKAVASPTYGMLVGDNTMTVYTNDHALLVRAETYDDAALFKTAVIGQQFVYELVTPITITLTPEQLTTVLGQNNVWSDAGDVSVTWKEKLYTEGY